MKILATLSAGCLSIGTPSIDTLELSPPQVMDTAPVTALATASDPQGDPITLEYRWYVNGVLAQPGPTLGNDAFSRGDTLRIEVTPSDPYLAGPPEVREVVVVNAPPTAPTAQILPEDAVWGRDALSCVASVPSIDPDGDPVTYREQWTADGAPFEGPVRGIDTTLARQWSCTLVPSDGLSEGPLGLASLSPPPSLSNVLVMLIDDVGNDRPAFIGEHPTPSVTPHLDQLAAEGVFFRNMYSSPLCSPSRVMAFTGRMPRRTGLGYIVDSHLWQVELPSSELTVPEVLALGAVPYENSFVGKFHMTSAVSGSAGPMQHGLGWFAGTLANPSEPPGAGYAWYDWGKVEGGELVGSQTYITTDSVDDALARMGIMTEPWLMWVSFNAVHKPLHRPPEELAPVTVLSDDPTDFEKHTADLEALDTEIGRMLAGLSPEVRARTTIVFTSDNGTDNEGTIAPWPHLRAKGTLYEAGVNVPLVISGPLVRQPGTETSALVHTVDLLPTLAAIAGLDVRELPNPLDGYDLLPFLADPEAPAVREVVFTEQFSKDLPVVDGRRERDDTWHANGCPPYAFQESMARDARWKLIRREEDGAVTWELYDMDGLDVEGPDLLQEPLSPDAQDAQDRLREVLMAELAKPYDVPNQPVYLADARVDPPLAPAGSDLSCIVGRMVDGDDDEVLLSYQWLEDGVLLPETSGILPAASYSFGAEVRCIVSGTDESGLPTSLEAVASFGL